MAASLTERRMGFSLINRWIRVEVFTFVIRAVALKSRLDDVAFGLTKRGVAFSLTNRWIRVKVVSFAISVPALLVIWVSSANRGIPYNYVQLENLKS